MASTATLVVRRSVTGMGLVVASAASWFSMRAAYDLAVTDPGRVDARYALFWVGLLVGVVPWLWTALRVSGRRSSLIAGACLFAAGLVSWLPRAFRGSGPVFYDEILHHGQLLRSIDAGWLATPENSLLPVLNAYPVLQQVGMVFHTFGLSTWWALAIPVVAAHALLPVGVARLAALTGVHEKTAMLAGALYLFTPGFLFFNAQVAYQSLALPLAVWALVLVLGAAARSAATPRLIAGLVVATVTVFTHHVAGLFTGVFLVLAGVFVSRRSDRAVSSKVLTSGVYVTTVSLIWAALSAGEVLSYLAPDVSDARSLLAGVLPGGDDSRVPFGTAGIPVWETYAGWAAPVVAVALLALGWFRLRRASVNDPLLSLGAFAGLLYAASLPFVLVPSISTWAHRLWPYLFVAASVLLAVGVREAFTYRLAPPPALRVGVRVLVPATLLVLAVGNVGTEVNDQYRFPGRAILGADARPPADVDDLVAWFATNAPGSTVLADPDVRNRVLAGAQAATITGFPDYDFFVRGFDPAPETIVVAALLGVDFLVFDDRAQSERSVRGFYFSPFEPDAYAYTAPLDPGTVGRLDAAPWLYKETTIGSFHVYRLQASCILRGTSVTWDALARVASSRVAIPASGFPVTVEEILARDEVCQTTSGS